MLETIVEANCLLLKSKAREIVKSALGLTKTLLTVVDQALMAQFLKQIVSWIIGSIDISKPRHPCTRALLYITHANKQTDLYKASLLMRCISPI